MIVLLIVLDAAVALAVILVTCIQGLYLESLRLHAREVPSLQFFKETLEAKIGLESEPGAPTFSLAKHLGLGILGCLTLAITMRSAPQWEALALACLLVGMLTL